MLRRPSLKLGLADPRDHRPAEEGARQARRDQRAGDEGRRRGRQDKATPPAEKPATKKAASIGDAIAKGVDAWCADEQAKADAEPKTIKATPPADELPDIPPFLDRRQTAEIDEEAAAIAAEASRKKQWLQ